MKLNLIEQFLLIALDDNKGEFIPDSFKLQAGFGGAVLFELLLQGHIKIIEKKVVPQDNPAATDKTLAPFLEKINNSKKERSLKDWLQRFTMETEKIKKETLAQLVEKGVLKKQENKVLWVFTFDKYPTVDDSAENQLRQQLKAIVLNGIQPEADELLLLILLKSCGLLPEVFGDKEKEAKTVIDRLTKNTAFESAIEESVREMEMLLTVSITTSTVIITST